MSPSSQRGHTGEREASFSSCHSSTNRSSIMNNTNEQVGVIRTSDFKATVSGIPADGGLHTIRITGTAQVTAKDVGETLTALVDNHSHPLHVEEITGTVRLSSV
jgi:hypothetical protein